MNKQCMHYSMTSKCWSTSFVAATAAFAQISFIYSAHTHSIHVAALSSHPVLGSKHHVNESVVPSGASMNDPMANQRSETPILTCSGAFSDVCAMTSSKISNDNRCSLQPHVHHLHLLYISTRFRALLNCKDLYTHVLDPTSKMYTCFWTSLCTAPC